VPLTDAIMRQFLQTWLPYPYHAKNATAVSGALKYSVTDAVLKPVLLLLSVE